MIFIIVVLAAAIVAAVFCFAAAAPLSAIGTDPVILSQDSKFAVGGDYVAYTYDGSLSIVDKSYNYSPITRQDAFSGEVLSIAMSDSEIALLTKLGGTRKVTVFPYDSDGIGEGKQETFSLGADYVTQAGVKQLYYRGDILCGLARSAVANDEGKMKFVKTAEPDAYTGASDFILSEGGERLYIAIGKHIKYDDNEPYEQIRTYNATPFPTDVKQIFSVDGVLAVNTEDGIYFEDEGGSFVAATDDVYTYVKGGQAEYSDGYIYIFDAL